MGHSSLSFYRIFFSLWSVSFYVLNWIFAYQLKNAHFQHFFFFSRLEIHQSLWSPMSSPSMISLALVNSLLHFFAVISIGIGEEGDIRWFSQPASSSISAALPLCKSFCSVIHYSIAMLLWWLILCINLIRPWGAQIFGQTFFSGFLWGCFWMSLTFKLIDLIKQIALLLRA